MAAATPEDLSRQFLERANAQDVDGLVALYEADAILVGQNSQTLKGRAAITGFYQAFLASRPVLRGEPQPALRNGDLALTWTHFTTAMGRTSTAEVARRQRDGTWLWLIDNPNVLRQEASRSAR